MAFYLGIDGGGSKTACAVGDETAVLAMASAGGSNPVRVGEAQAQANLRVAIGEACKRARISPAEVRRTCVGMAGISAPDTRRVVQAAVGECVGGDVLVTGDTEIALEAALGHTAGVVVIAGTGSIAVGRDGNGRTARAGGWGHAISDEGSGHWIGRRAVAMIMRALDTDEPTALAEAVMTEWNVSSQAELVKMGNCIPPPDFARLFPAVVRAAAAGDQLANELLGAAGVELSALATIVIRQLWPDASKGSGCERVALGGGVFRHSTVVRHAFYKSLRQRRENVAVSFAIVEPVLGALAMARKAA